MFHRTDLGSFAEGIPSDGDGYVPELGDSPEQMAWALHRGPDGELHRVGWPEGEPWPDFAAAELVHAS